MRMSSAQWQELRGVIEGVRYGRVTLYLSPERETLNITVEHDIHLRTDGGLLTEETEALAGKETKMLV
jgi:hypothetical protein